MAAGVHPALMRRAVGKGVGLEDRQAVHVRPEPDRARRVADPQPPDDPGLAEAAMHLDAEPGKPVGNEIGGALLLEAELGVGVNVAAESRQLVVKGANPIENVHLLIISRSNSAASL